MEKKLVPKLRLGTRYHEAPLRCLLNAAKFSRALEAELRKQRSQAELGNENQSENPPARGYFLKALSAGLPPERR